VRVIVFVCVLVGMFVSVCGCVRECVCVIVCVLVSAFGSVCACVLRLYI